MQEKTVIEERIASVLGINNCLLVLTIYDDGTDTLRKLDYEADADLLAAAGYPGHSHN